MSWILPAGIAALVTAIVSAGVVLFILQQRNLTESAARLRALYEENRAVMMVSDAATGQVIDANPAALTFYGWTIEEMRERRIWDINVGGASLVSSPSRGPGGDEGPLLTIQRTADGSMRDVEIFASHATVHGTLVLYSIVHDVTSRRLAERQLEAYRRNLESLVQARTAELVDTNRRLRQANDAKGRFLHNMSHELRTPLNSIIGFSGMLAQGLAGELNPEQQVQVGMIEQSGRRLLELVESVLDVTAIAAEPGTTVLEDADVVMLAREALDSVRAIAVHKGLRLCDNLGDAECRTATDGPQVRQILVNLLSNAVKFTDAGEVSMNLECVDGGIRLSVTDTGCGIAAERQSVVFEEFTQVDVPGLAKPPGAGLGLTVAKALTKRLGGRIEMSSKAGQGSTFTLVLPAAPDASSAPAD